MNSLPILNYHGVERQEGEYGWHESERGYVLSHKVFEIQMKHLHRNHFATLTLDQMGEWLESEVWQKAVVLTFDDGHLSHYEHVAPCLSDCHLKGIFFIPSGLVGQSERMSWTQLKELVSDGFEIGSHGLNHIPLTNLPYDQLKEELGKSKGMLEDKLGVEVKSFSIPRGFFQPRIAQMAGEMGYQFLFTSQFDVNQRGADPLSLKRLVVKEDLSLAGFSGMIEGDLGIKKYAEQLKESMRQTIPPGVYDALATFKRVLSTRE